MRKRATSSRPLRPTTTRAQGYQIHAELAKGIIVRCACGTDKVSVHVTPSVAEAGEAVDERLTQATIVLLLNSRSDGHGLKTFPLRKRLLRRCRKQPANNAGGGQGRGKEFACK